MKKQEIVRKSKVELDVFLFATHYDDAELGMCGRIAKLTSEGKSIGIIVLQLQS